jgi:hypothetical protein
MMSYFAWPREKHTSDDGRGWQAATQIGSAIAVLVTAAMGGILSNLIGQSRSVAIIIVACVLWAVACFVWGRGWRGAAAGLVALIGALSWSVGSIATALLCVGLAVLILHASVSALDNPDESR